MILYWIFTRLIKYLGLTISTNQGIKLAEAIQYSSNEKRKWLLHKNIMPFLAVSVLKGVESSSTFMIDRVCG